MDRVPVPNSSHGQGSRLPAAIVVTTAPCMNRAGPPEAYIHSNAGPCERAWPPCPNALWA
jgi:hypothetical protein